MINFLREISQKEKILSKTNSNSLLEHLQIFFGIKNPGIFYSGNFFWNLKESLRTQITGWHRSLIWCPSQLHKEYTYRDYTVSCYARWRHTDPWTGHFILQKNTDFIILGKSMKNIKDAEDIIKKKIKNIYKKK